MAHGLTMLSQLKSDPSRQPLVGMSRVMRELRNRIEVVARSDPQITILIRGPTGSGKELVAKAIHQQNPKTRGNVFIAVDLSYVPRELAGSELFGHEKGAFTDAREKHVGAFETGGQGTVFLDEVSSISLAFQSMFLRVLQEREFSPLGSARNIHTNARIIAATNEDLWAKVQNKQFRQDLYFRLKMLEVQVPSLADRKTDIPLLVQHFMQKHAHKVGCATSLPISKEVYAVLRGREWPGNVRELENVVIQGMASAALRGQVSVSDLPPEERHVDPFRLNPSRALLELPYQEAKQEVMNEFKRIYWQNRIGCAGGSISRAARDAGVLPTSLHRMLKELGISGHTEH